MTMPSRTALLLLLGVVATALYAAIVDIAAELTPGYSHVAQGPGGAWLVRSATHCGEVAERSIATVLKTVDRKVRGFESHPLRHAEVRDCNALAGERERCRDDQ
jgi:hypothetical protein